MNIKIKSLVIISVSFFIVFPVFSASLKRENAVLKYKYSNSFEKGTETVYYFKDKFCVRRYTEAIEEPRKSLPKNYVLSFLMTKPPKKAYRIVSDEKYVYEINDLEKTVSRTKKPVNSEISEIRKKREKEFYSKQNKQLADEIESMITSKYAVSFETVQNAKEVTYFGKPCKTFTLMGATFIYWEDVLLFREIPFEDKTKEVLEIQSIDLDANIDLSVFEIPSYYKIKEVSPKDFISLITKIMPEKKNLSDIKK